MEKWLTTQKFKYVFLILAIITFPESMKHTASLNKAIINVVFWICFTLLLINEQNNKPSNQ
ncbi:hypothetical protein AsAng_0059650 [Aureispira anguillae]|uniref:Uncharacterized protein n=1 Tax=Aureispira anguillae TaxID=2864201 RepID=A0A915YLK5_9BACT|nr:hypothetical protein AsAng_0059650 [Aureispira anguillae]